jgi:hypothetical protein
VVYLLRGGGHFDLFTYVTMLATFTSKNTPTFIVGVFLFVTGLAALNLKSWSYLKPLRRYRVAGIFICPLL